MWVTWQCFSLFRPLSKGFTVFWVCVEGERCSQICMRTVDPPNETHAYPWIVPWIQKMGAISTPGSYRGSKKWELKVPLDRTVDPKNGNQKYPWIVPWIRQSVPPSNFKNTKVPLDPYPLTVFKTRKYPWIRTP